MIDPVVAFDHGVAHRRALGPADGARPCGVRSRRAVTTRCVLHRAGSPSLISASSGKRPADEFRPSTGSAPNMTTATSNEDDVRRLIERWAAAVHDGNIEAVLDRHDADIVMFDVPPPQDGVRGLDAYRSTWPAFFEWQRQGAAFEIISLDVTAGADVAFAFALLRCGTPDELTDRPDRRLRLTIGLRRHDDEWTVTHEHHSFTQP